MRKVSATSNPGPNPVTRAPAPQPARKVGKPEMLIYTRFPPPPRAPFCEPANVGWRKAGNYQLVQAISSPLPSLSSFFTQQAEAAFIFVICQL